MVTVLPAVPARCHCWAKVLSAGSRVSCRVSESRTVSPTAIVRFPCAARALALRASEATSFHGSMAPRNLRSLDAAHNLGGGGREGRHDGGAKGARLPHVRGAAAGLHQQPASPDHPRRLGVAPAVRPP